MAEFHPLPHDPEEILKFWFGELDLLEDFENIKNDLVNGFLVMMKYLIKDKKTV